jgi:hypothetical protein
LQELEHDLAVHPAHRVYNYGIDDSKTKHPKIIEELIARCYYGI